MNALARTLNGRLHYAWITAAIVFMVLLVAAGLGLFGMFYGLDWIATVPPTVRLTTDAFGERDAPVERVKT